MTKLQEKTQIKEAIEEYCRIKGISRNELALQIGVSSATLSNMCNDKWNSIDDKMWKKVWHFVRPESTHKIFHTHNLKTAMGMAEKARKHKLMLGLIGDTGMGKTVALKAIARNENTFYLYFDNQRPKQFFYQLGKLLGYDFEGSLYDMIGRACDALNVLEEPLLMIDEAGKLNDVMLMHLHVLRDRTMHNCAIMLAGMPYFKLNLENKAKKQKIGISEFYRRINIWHELEALNRSEIDFICEQNGIPKSETKDFYQHKRFGDLSNAILLYNTINE
ncbi:AAA family ATPase [Sphingobacterium siyangense]|uniref:DNA transposition AAA+ family ATPase n=1 Tax=Sphingobacterium siyangense TaxID=459529 RepID=A0A562M924_9SPHI|nr:AAA family ATPase [Sphingobacterium siyangense]TWI16308.1 DNA transposition AAA+ family ATPase [Sphingobacterium siyangense]